MGRASRQKADRRAQQAAGARKREALDRLTTVLPAAGEPMTAEATAALQALYRSIFSALDVDQTAGLRALPKASFAHASLSRAIEQTRHLERVLLVGAERAPLERAS